MYALTFSTLVLNFSQGHSSAKRKGLLAAILARAKFEALVLLIDMKVRWSSTYAMLKRAYLLKDVRHLFHCSCTLVSWLTYGQFFTEFIYEVASEEPDLDKRANIKLLKLSSGEWKRVALFMKLLEVRYAIPSFAISK